MGIETVEKFSVVRICGFSYFSLGPWSYIVLGKPGAPQMLGAGMNELTPITE